MHGMQRSRRQERRGRGRRGRAQAAWRPGAWRRHRASGGSYRARPPREELARTRSTAGAAPEPGRRPAPRPSPVGIAAIVAPGLVCGVWGRSARAEVGATLGRARSKPLVRRPGLPEMHTSRHTTIAEELAAGGVPASSGIGKDRTERVPDARNPHGPGRRPAPRPSLVGIAAIVAPGLVCGVWGPLRAIRASRGSAPRSAERVRSRWCGVRGSRRCIPVATRLSRRNWRRGSRRVVKGAGEPAKGARERRKQKGAADTWARRNGPAQPGPATGPARPRTPAPAQPPGRPAPERPARTHLPGAREPSAIIGSRARATARPRRA